MSDASDAAIARAMAEAKKMGQRVNGPDTNNEILIQTAGSARELRLIRGELEAIRILLSEGAAQGVTASGFDSGNA